MAVTTVRQEAAAMALERLATADESYATCELSCEDEAEVLGFLSARPIHTVFMASLIRDNGLLSPLNRGSFYTCSDHQGKLEGVALIGHATLVEARTETALAAFARVAQQRSSGHLIRGESEKVDGFWRHYARADQRPRLVAREVLLEQRAPLPQLKIVDSLRPATPGDLEQVIAVNAAMAFEEGDVNPLDTDPEGFRQRLARRIEQGRIWVWVNGDKLIFKADIVGDTPQVIYLEGVYVHPEERRKGYGLRCMTQLGWTLLSRTGSICLTVNEKNQGPLAFCLKAGYQPRDYYETIYLHRETDA